MRDPKRLPELYRELYRLHVRYGEDKSPAQFFCDIAQHDVFSTEDGSIINELYRRLDVPDTEKCGKTSILPFYMMMCSIHERCPDMRLGQLIVCLQSISQECLNKPMGVFIQKIDQFIK